MNTPKGLDLTQVPPRSPHERIGGFVIVARTIDKCRASLWGKVGEYHFDCPVDNSLFPFMGIKGDQFKAFVETGAGDAEIVEWMKKVGTKHTDAEIEEWSRTQTANDFMQNPPEKRAWFTGELERLGLEKGTTLFDYLVADDRASLPMSAK